MSIPIEDLFRFGAGGFFMAYSMVFFNAEGAVSDLNLKFGITGLGVAIFGIGFVSHVLGCLEFGDP
jgi:hypothetical protein